MVATMNPARSSLPVSDSRRTKRLAPSLGD
jgi:hypothetical protein